MLTLYSTLVEEGGRRKEGNLDSSFLYCKARGRSDVKMLQLPRGDRPPARAQGRWEAHSWGGSELLLVSLEH